MEQLRIFSNLELDDASTEWVNLIWTNNFITYPDPPDDYHVLIIRENVDCILKDTKLWLNSYDDFESNVSWKTLNTTGINSRNLLATLGYVIKTGQRIGASEDARQSCLRAISLYLTLLSIPGSKAYQIFHPNLFQSAIEAFKLVDYLIPNYKKPNKSMDFPDLCNESEEDSRTTLTQQEKITLTQDLNCIMSEMINTFKHFGLKDQERSMEILVNCLIEIAKAETDNNPLSLNVKLNKASLTSLSYGAYIALKDLCDPKHGPVEVTIRLIIKCVFQHLLTGHIGLPTKSINMLRETVITFLKILLESHAKDAKLGIQILVQQMMANYPERLEARQKQTVVIARIIALCRGSLFHDVIETLVLYSHNSKIMYRIFAQEITSKLLFKLNCKDSHSENSLARLHTKKILIGLVFAKCNDVSNMVRGKAMSVVSEIIDKSNSNVYSEIFQIMFDATNAENPLPTIEQLRSALNEDSNPLPGSNSILQMLFNRVEDERALVRCSALKTLKNMTFFKPEALNQIVSIIGRHCRDLSIAVRKFAIQMLTQLLQESPENYILLKVWVTSVVSQIFDMEAKVQEKVLEAMEQLILKNVIWSGSMTSDSTDLPWRIIDELVRVEMRKYLAKACAMWVQKKITRDNAYIFKIRTHIGTNHEVQAWVLLATFCDTLQLKNLDIYFANYNEIISSNKYQSKLMLEVLRNSWPNINKDLLQRMQADFYKSLCQFEVSFECIGICIDILDRVIKHQQPNGEHALEANILTLMKSCEIKIDKIFNDGSVDVCPLRVMCTLGQAASLCTGHITSSTLNILLAMLLSWETIPLSLQHHIMLRPFGILLLGQFALRDREVAEQVTAVLSYLMCQTSENESPTETAIRVNAAKMLADLCERFTALVEPFLPNMCICMQDPNPRVREVTVVIFIQLLLEDFIKVKGLIFSHILTMILDPDENIRELTVFLIRERLLVNNKTLISKQFIKSIFHYNDCTLQNKVCDLKITEKEKSMLAISGSENELKRRNIYDFMLEYMDPPGKLKLLDNLTMSILNRFCNNTLLLKRKNEKCLLKDTLYILSSDYIQPNFNTNRQNDDLQEENATPVTVHNKAIKCLTETAKVFKMEKLLPVMIELKIKLKNLKSSVEEHVDRFFAQSILEFTKDQLKFLLIEYPELEEKIDNIRKHGKQLQLNDQNSEEKEDESEGQNINSSRSKTKSKGKSLSCAVATFTND